MRMCVCLQHMHSTYPSHTIKSVLFFITLVVVVLNKPLYTALRAIQYIIVRIMTLFFLFLLFTSDANNGGPWLSRPSCINETEYSYGTSSGSQPELTRESAQCFFPFTEKKNMNGGKRIFVDAGRAFKYKLYMCLLCIARYNINAGFITLSYNTDL